jgi:50S ribosomal protein L16 3-hydroxylase
MPVAMPDGARPPLLGGRNASTFLRRFWQKNALVVRSALPGFQGLFTSRQLAKLAMRDDVESRLIVREGTRWSLAHGPFRRADFDMLPERNWTLLVQGANLHASSADALLRRFDFLPFARLDDVMVSLAAPGGGVGPHVDSYDVFLLQGAGRRRWRYGRQADLALRPRLPLKILRDFAPQHDVVLHPGDMLYVPPSYAHDGVAIDACTTYSIGFRAPEANELASAFLDWLRDGLSLDGHYADPDLRASGAPARIDPKMQRRCAAMLASIRWNRKDIDRFLGTFLSEPKASVFFAPPAPPMSRAAFDGAARRQGVRLDRRSQLLYDDRQLFVNGVALAWPSPGSTLLRRLANERALPGAAMAYAPPRALRVMYDWYCNGYLDTDAA